MRTSWWEMWDVSWKVLKFFSTKIGKLQSRVMMNALTCLRKMDRATSVDRVNQGGVGYGIKLPPRNHFCLRG